MISKRIIFLFFLIIFSINILYAIEYKIIEVKSNKNDIPQWTENGIDEYNIKDGDVFDENIAIVIPLGCSLKIQVNNETVQKDGFLRIILKELSFEYNDETSDKKKIVSSLNKIKDIIFKNSKFQEAGVRGDRINNIISLGQLPDIISEKEIRYVSFLYIKDNEPYIFENCNSNFFRFYPDYDISELVNDSANNEFYIEVGLKDDKDKYKYYITYLTKIDLQNIEDFKLNSSFYDSLYSSEKWLSENNIKNYQGKTSLLIQNKE